MNERHDKLFRKLVKHIVYKDGVRELVSLGFTRKDLYDLGIEPFFLPGNTEVTYLYRNGSNHRRYSTYVILGALSEEEKGEIWECLIDKKYFYPSMVGLPDDSRYSGTNADAEWYELASIMDTDKDPTNSLTATELLKNFRNARNNWGL